MTQIISNHSRNREIKNRPCDLSKSSLKYAKENLYTYSAAASCQRVAACNRNPTTEPLRQTVTEVTVMAGKIVPRRSEFVPRHCRHRNRAERYQLADELKEAKYVRQERHPRYDYRSSDRQ